MIKQALLKFTFLAALKAGVQAEWPMPSIDQNFVIADNVLSPQAVYQTGKWVFDGKYVISSYMPKSFPTPTSPGWLELKTYGPT